MKPHLIHLIISTKGYEKVAIHQKIKLKGKRQAAGQVDGKGYYDPVILWDFLMKSDRKLHTSNRIPGSLYLRVMEF